MKKTVAYEYNIMRLSFNQHVVKMNYNDLVKISNVYFVRL